MFCHMKKERQRKRGNERKVQKRRERERHKKRENDREGRERRSKTFSRLKNLLNPPQKKEFRKKVRKKINFSRFFLKISPEITIGMAMPSRGTQPTTDWPKFISSWALNTLSLSSFNIFPIKKNIFRCHYNTHINRVNVKCLLNIRQIANRMS